jgi:hypothetical protein
MDGTPARLSTGREHPTPVIPDSDTKQRTQNKRYTYRNSPRPSRCEAREKPPRLERNTTPPRPWGTDTPPLGVVSDNLVHVEGLYPTLGLLANLSDNTVQHPLSRDNAPRHPPALLVFQDGGDSLVTGKCDAAHLERFSLSVFDSDDACVRGR